MGPRILKVTLLGTGSSSGVPKVGGDWGECDPAEPRNRRRRCCALVELGPENGPFTTVLIDTSPDLREQLLDTGTTHLDAVLYTHDHADQTHGIDDLRHLAGRMRRRIPVFLDKATFRTLGERFGYCFEMPPGSFYPPILEARIIPGPLHSFQIEGPGGTMDVLPVDQDHGMIRSLGFRIGPMAYSADVVDFPRESLEALRGLECFICDALRWRSHTTHSHVDKTLGWFRELNVPHGVLTNLHIDLDYRTLCAYVPDTVTVGYDNLTLRFEVP
ncbi:MAG: MBL fold metallo-hydrolase [Alphaproteobacteria bacterium]